MVLIYVLVAVGSGAASATLLWPEIGWFALLAAPFGGSAAVVMLAVLVAAAERVAKR